MDSVHSEIITNNIVKLTNGTDVSRLVPKLIAHNVFTQSMINRILDNANTDRLKATSLYMNVRQRGPFAFNNLISALNESDHEDLATMLRSEEIRSRDMNANGPSYNQQPISNGVHFGSLTLSSSMDDTPDSMPSSGHIQPMCLPQAVEENLRTIMNAGQTDPGDLISLNDPFTRRKPVVVKKSTRHFKPDGRLPDKYRTTSNPRGYALIINNINFLYEPTRNGAKNDGEDMESLCKQLHFQVELHIDKTKQEMEKIVENFAKKDWRTMDCLFVVIMSHGGEGERGEEDTVIKGTDSVGFRTSDILSYFYNNACPQLFNKPKIFIFQSCRGILTDPGVEIDPFDDASATFSLRTETDGQKIERRIRDRTVSDMIVAYPVLPGRTANRDIYDGAWFIQAIVEVFSQHACDSDLLDLFTIVDQKIKALATVNNERNHQTVTFKTLGWSKKFYFNPGIYWDEFQGTVIERDTANGYGMDVVDTPSEILTLKDTDDDPDDRQGACCFKCNIG